MKDYEIAMKKWGAKLLKENNWREVYVDLEDLGHGCPTCGYGGGMEFDIRGPKGSKTDRSFSVYVFERILEEMLAIEITDEDRELAKNI